VRPARTGWLLLSVITVAMGCSDDPTTELPKDLDRDALMKPSSCEPCHAEHVKEWSGSMHAYAADDPVFLAMNAFGQRETNGELGDFCVSCHAPMAVRTGATTDGLNLDEVPQHLKGVTCYFCHSVEAVTDTHNNPLELADDDVLRGGISDPVDNTAHLSAYASLLDRKQHESASMCGSCHDIVTPAGVHLERTFAEWQDSLFANKVPSQQLTCGNCHMDGREGVAADAPNVLVRTVHDHSMPGVDIAVTPFPEIEAQRESIQLLLDGTLVAELCVVPDIGGVKIDVTLDNAFAGHGWPSGAGQDRRAWVEVVAYDDADAVIYESGVVADNEPVAELADPDLWLFRDRTFDGDGNEVHMFWEAASFESEQLSPGVTNDPSDPAYYHSQTRSYVLPMDVPKRVSLKVHMRPIGLEVLDEVVQSGDLDPSVIDAMPQFTLAGTELEWDQDVDGFGCVP
jgi:hypothetical protein